MNSKPGQIKVGELIEKYKKGEIGIPEFQRNYVWKNERILKLLDSIYKSYPIGALIIWTPPLGHIVQSKERQGSRPVQWLIDGQQRTKSLANAIDDTNLIAFNPIIPEFRIMRKRRDRFIPIDQIFDDEKYPSVRENYKETYGNSPEIEKNFEACRKIKDFPLAMIEMDGHNYEDTIEAFKRVNTQGIRLRGDDIQSAEISFKHTGFIKKKVQPTLKMLNNKGYDRIYSGHLFQACNFILKDNYRDKRTIFDKDISTEVLERNWRKLEEGLKWMINILDTELGIKNMTLVPSGPSLIPIAVLYSKLPATQRDVKKIIKWFICTVVKRRYEKSTDTTLIKDLEACLEHNPIEALFRKGNISHNFALRPSSLDLSYNDRIAAIILYIATIYNKGVDIFTRQKIKGNSRLNKHHIYPQKHFRNSSPEEKELINQIGNITFLTTPVNQALKEELPESYLQRVRKLNRNSVFIFDEPAELKLSKYKSFINKRKKLICTSFNKFLSNEL